MRSISLFLFLFFSLFGYSQVQVGNDINGQQINELFGQTVSLSADGKTLAVGAPQYEDNWHSSVGRVQVYRLHSSGSWNQMGQDLNSNYAAISFGYFGAAISLSSDGKVLACVGQNLTPNGVAQLAIQVYHLNVLGNWTQITNDIILPTGNNTLNNYLHQKIISLSADGNILAVGNPGLAINGQFSGQVKVFRNVSGTWVQLGQDINGNSVNEGLGYSVSLSGNGNILAVSTINGVEIYRTSSLISPNWKSIGSIFTNTEGFISLSSSGSVVAVSSVSGLNSMGVNSGYVAVYGYESGNWVKLGQNIEGTFLSEGFGITNSLSADGKIIAIGRIGTSVFNVSDSLQTQVYEYVSGTWTQLHGNINGYSFKEDNTSVSLSGDGSFVAVGSFRGNGSPDPGTGYVRVFDTTQPVSSSTFVSQSFTIYPNPTSDVLNIGLDNNLVLEKVTVYNSLGQIVKTAYEPIIAMSGLAKGLYFVEVTTPEGKAVKKVIVE